MVWVFIGVGVGALLVLLVGIVFGMRRYKNRRHKDYKQTPDTEEKKPTTAADLSGVIGIS